MTDNTRPTIEFIHYGDAEAARQHLRIGHYFVFAGAELSAPADQRFSRLLVKQGSARKPRVVPLLDSVVELCGLRISPPRRDIDALACVVCDRDLYRAEQDTAHLFVASASPIDDPRLHVRGNGDLLLERSIELDGGMAIEPLAMLLPGRYEAQLYAGERPIGPAARFTVAQYTLAPLSGRLLSHRLERKSKHDTLTFELAVESYQLPFDDKLRVGLIDGDQEVDRIHLTPTRPGRFGGKFKFRGQGPYRLRLTAKNDAERIAEVVIPGSRANERDQTRLSELGTERLFSLMPEPEAIAVRGGYLSSGISLQTPLVVDELITSQPRIRLTRAAEALVAIAIDLESGDFDVEEHQDLAEGSCVDIATRSGVTMVFCGAVVDGAPFEGYTTFIRPPTIALSIDAPKSARPGALAQIIVSTTASQTAVGPSHPYREASASPRRRIRPVVRARRTSDRHGSARRSPGRRDQTCRCRRDSGDGSCHLAGRRAQPAFFHQWQHRRSRLVPFHRMLEAIHRSRAQQTQRPWHRS